MDLDIGSFSWAEDATGQLMVLTRPTGKATSGKQPIRNA
jgi:hypothetical protein